MFTAGDLVVIGVSVLSAGIGAWNAFTNAKIREEISSVKVWALETFERRRSAALSSRCNKQRRAKP